MKPPMYPRYTGSEPCRSTDPEAFYPEAPSNQYYQVLKTICRSCDMIEPCAEYATWFERDGFWGGLSPIERRNIRRRRNIIIDQTERDYAA